MEKDVRNQEEPLRKQFDQETKRLVGQGEASITNSTNRLSTVSPSVSAAEQSFDNNNLPTDPLMPDLEDSTGIFRGAYDDEDVGAEADLNNLEHHECEEVMFQLLGFEDPRFFDNVYKKEKAI
ncbi:hypothetical protein Tco_0245797 [Tanacetum coccineum]